MVLANQEAQRLNHTEVEPEHVLLGLIKEGSGVAAHVLKEFHLDLEKTRREVEMFHKMGPDISTMNGMPLTGETASLIILARQEAKGLKHEHIGTEHLLLGLIRLTESNLAETVQKIFLFQRQFFFTFPKQIIGRNFQIK